MLNFVRRDARRYAEYGGWFRSLGFWVGATYRFGVWARQLPTPFLRVPALVLYWFANFPWHYWFSAEIPPTARIGPGLLLLHPFNVLVGDGSELGEECAVFHEVTVGWGPIPGLPHIGNGVVLFAGSRVLGGVTIGDRTEIGANCVVTRNVPAHSIVTAPPVRVLPQSLIRAAEPGAEER